MTATLGRSGSFVRDCHKSARLTVQGTYAKTSGELGTRTAGTVAKHVIHEGGFARAASPSRATEQAAVSSAFASDVRAVLDAARPFESTLAMLGELAIVALDVALREAAGRPQDARWRAGFLAMDDFVAYYLRHSADADESRSFERLSSFLFENADLGHDSVGARD